MHRLSPSSPSPVRRDRPGVRPLILRPARATAGRRGGQRRRPAPSALSPSLSLSLFLNRSLSLSLSLPAYSLSLSLACSLSISIYLSTFSLSVPFLPPSLLSLPPVSPVSPS
jgi:hypothetical protein